MFLCAHPSESLKRQKEKSYIIILIDLSNQRLNLSSPALGMDSVREWLATVEYR
jgi:hypothetical protein